MNVETAGEVPAVAAVGGGPGRGPSAADDLALQDRLLEGVSRTFALTIPQIPPALRPAVGNAYLLCRTVDTIEDEPALDAAATRELAEAYVEVVQGRASAQAFAERLGPRLSEATLPAERELVAAAPRVIRLLEGFPPAQQAAIRDCVTVMARGMVEFQQRRSPAGLPDLAAMDRYCYHVAGVVGEMLTRLFCDQFPPIARHRERLMALAVSFGQGLQMTNILKDVWEDRARGACWLPRDRFAARGLDLATLEPGDPAFAAGLRELVGVAHHHLRAALEYTLLLPREQTGLRNFCLWAIGMAVLTLRRVAANPGYRSGQEVKIPRRSVYATVLLARAAARHDSLLRRLLAAVTAGLPLTDPDGLRGERG